MSNASVTPGGAGLIPGTDSAQPWLEDLCQHVEAKPCVLLRLDESDSERLSGSRGGFNEFTLARTHDLLSDIKPPTACLIFNATPDWMRLHGEQPHANIGIVSSRGPITTLDTRIKVKCAVRITPASANDLLGLLGATPQATQLRKKLETNAPVVVLSPKLSRAVIEVLAAIPSNRPALQAVAESLHAPRRFTSFSAVQEDAVQTALEAFGLGASYRAEQVELIEGQSTALARIPLMEDALAERGPLEDLTQLRRTPLIEDAVIEHDARSLPGYSLTSSDQTGRAVFKKGLETLQVITANRRDLEHVLGVDLIYLNLAKRNIVMVQYKMLDPKRRDGQPTDWLYRPDGKLAEQIAKMKRFAAEHAPGPLEYRLNPQVFYLKFVKRDGVLRNGSIITPIDHYEQLVADPACRRAQWSPH